MTISLLLAELLGSKRKQKLLLIHQALTSDPVAVETLRGAAVSEGGLLTDEIRRKVWPKLLSVNVYNLPPKPGRGAQLPGVQGRVCAPGPHCWAGQHLNGLPGTRGEF